jgi:very-short-patch-repair endonuclease
MKHEHINRTAPNGKSIPIVVLDGDVWFSQGSLARLFSKTKANVSLHLKDICARAGNIQYARKVSLTQVEGRRQVGRAVTHYALEACHMIALRGQHWVEQNWLMQLASEVNPHKREYRIVPVKERDFRELVETVLHGIVKVECQYRVGKYFIDFYLPEFALAIEFDELHHAAPSNIAADRGREKAIKRVIPTIQFIRVPEGRELENLNEILRKVIQAIARQPDSDRRLN